MAQDFARQFYNSKTWKHNRDAYMKSVGGLCERCLARGMYNPAEIVHHKTELTPENISDERIALDFGNLEAVCRKCHAEEHEGTYAARDTRGKIFGHVTRKKRWRYDRKTGAIQFRSPRPGE